MNPKEKLQLMRQAEINPGLAILTIMEFLRKEMQTMVAEQVAGVVPKLADSVVLKHIEKLKGDTGPQGDLADEEAVVERVKNLVLSLIPKPKDGISGLTPTKDELVALMMPLIPQVKDGLTPTSEQIKQIMMPLIPVIESVEVPTEEEFGAMITSIVKQLMPEQITLEQVLEKIKADPNFTIDASKVLNLPKPKKGKDGKYYHGGGVSSLTAGTGITLTPDGNGGFTISSTATGGSKLVPTGAVNGSNQTFVFTSAPSIISVDGGRFMQKVSSDGTVNWTGNTNITLTIAPTFDIFGL